jgi:hypothetical protein
MAVPTTESAPNPFSEMRSEQRVNFCQSIARRAREICDELVLSWEWRNIFNDEQDSSVRHEPSHSGIWPLVDFRSSAERLNQKLQALPRNNDRNFDGPLLTIAFDEAATFLEQETSGLSPGRYVALNRIISLLKRNKIWVFFISTESQIQHMFPPDIVGRTSIILDIEHLAVYSRPLWMAYVEIPEELKVLASQKLLQEIKPARSAGKF